MLPEIWVNDDTGAACKGTACMICKTCRNGTGLLGLAREIVEGGFESCWNCGAPMPPL